MNTPGWGALSDMELAIVRRTVPAGPLPAGAEMTGRNYDRPQVGPLVQTHPGNPGRWENELALMWALAPESWGLADTLALVLADDTVLATARLPDQFQVAAFDQMQVRRHVLQVLGVPPSSGIAYGAGTFGGARFGHYPARPFGAGAFGQSLFGTYPRAGAVWGITAQVSLAWARQANRCTPWTRAPAIKSGGCAQ